MPEQIQDKRKKQTRTRTLNKIRNKFISDYEEKEIKAAEQKETYKNYKVFNPIIIKK